MTTLPEGASLEARRLTIRRRALANLLLGVRDEAARSNGRFDVEGLDDALCLRFRDVRTLVCTERGHAEAVRDFTVIVVAPPLWPFDREAALVPIVAAPADFRHPNSDGHQFCLDTRGVTPERLAALIHDNLRLKNRRLDHPVDGAAAAFVRSRLPDRPTDPRALDGSEVR
jgi:hypothetical protein